MKINQVEELTGITKKNIRFYESEGLIAPRRDPANGYREYSLEDADTLRRIKLLRKLDVSCEKIRKLQEGKISLAACMDDQLTLLSHRQRDLAHMQEICRRLMEEERDFSGLASEIWLEQMKEMEKGGIRFMDVRESDVRKRRSGAIAAAAACICFFGLFLGVTIWANHEDPAPAGVMVVIVVLFGAMILGTLLALLQRLREVKKGEIDEASKY
ncbi:MAG: MerR family transcriptional regulator [bacterium]